MKHIICRCVEELKTSWVARMLFTVVVASFAVSVTWNDVSRIYICWASTTTYIFTGMAFICYVLREEL